MVSSYSWPPALVLAVAVARTRSSGTDAKRLVELTDPMNTACRAPSWARPVTGSWETIGQDGKARSPCGGRKPTLYIRQPIWVRAEPIHGAALRGVRLGSVRHRAGTCRPRTARWMRSGAHPTLNGQVSGQSNRGGDGGLPPGMNVHTRDMAGFCAPLRTCTTQQRP